MVLAAVLLAAASTQQQGASAGRPVLVCVDAVEAGLAGKPPLITGFVTSRGARQPAQLYINGTVIKTVGIWEANSTKPQVQNLTVLPPVIKGLVCFPPGDPAPAGRGLYIEVEARGRRHGVTIINATEEPAAPPALPLEYVADHFEIVKGRVVARRAIRSADGENTAQTQPPSLVRNTEQIQPLSLITPGPDIFERFSGDIVASFKLAQTDNYVLDLSPYRTGEVCARGRFILPNGTSSFTLSFTPATRAEIYGGASCLLLSIKANITDEDTGQRLASNLILNGSSMVAPGIHCVPNPPRPWYLVHLDLSSWRDRNKRVDLRICVPASMGGYGRDYIDAFIHAVVPARSYAQPFALESPGQGTVVKVPPGGVEQLYDGTYIAVPGFTVPPGYVLGSARSNIIIKVCSPQAPTSINVYWGPFYIGTVSRTQTSDGCYQYEVSPQMFTGALNTAASASLYVGGTTHALFIGPFNSASYYSGIQINRMTIQGLYRPEMNARSSIIFAYPLTWSYFTASGFATYYDPYSGTLIRYGTKTEFKLLADWEYHNTRSLISLHRYDGQLHCSRVDVYIWAYNATSGSQIAMEHGSAKAFRERAGGFSSTVIDILIDFISNVFDETNRRVSAFLKVISWATFAIDLLEEATDTKVSAGSSGGGVVYSIELGSLAPPVAINTTKQGLRLPPDAFGTPIRYVMRIDMVCGGVRYSYGPYSIYLNTMPWTFSRSTIHLFRTFTCGKQEIADAALLRPEVYGRWFICDASRYG
ncbi:hypothetical protein P186_2783 [Pyrobaculum ferrireducens]|uniref:Uncharacterized protein n=2 Tax=Pyrobaculum ferrireducens TaxID=1104324 RepID=G7VEZ4_9CREN|nr:hypothetical protein P186_2783 [Pyrobaculum ferrireducens]